MLIWHILDSETQEKLKELAPEGWQPPKPDTRNVIIPLEKLEEIDKIMRKPPRRKGD